MLLRLVSRQADDQLHEEPLQPTTHLRAVEGLRTLFYDAAKTRPTSRNRLSRLCRHEISRGEDQLNASRRQKQRRVQNQVKVRRLAPVGAVIEPDVLGATVVLVAHAALGLGPADAEAPGNCVDAERQRRHTSDVQHARLARQDELGAVPEDHGIARGRRLADELARHAPQWSFGDLLIMKLLRVLAASDAEFIPHDDASAALLLARAERLVPALERLTAGLDSSAGIQSTFEKELELLREDIRQREQFDGRRFAAHLQALSQTLARRTH